ncbi:MAG: 50S ribosomal protein L29 [Candidatus Omnitrophica bacterium]|nr:50S ribosomal protein L29 [Candidatus Omnitrophota bacterium]
MDLKELNNLNNGELVQREQFLKKELFDMRQQSRLGQVEKPARFGTLKKEVAQILTILNERKNGNGKKN